jgi:beta-carotene/zeaxanthin 4-ketolase
MTEIAKTKNANEAAVNLDKSISLVLAILIIGSWLGVHVVAIFLVDWLNPKVWALAPALIILQTWLSVGLFIIAHDTMHGSLAPGIPWLNRLIGQFCVMVYAGFSYQKLYESHHAHHRHVGTAEDPDFDVDHPKEFWPWYRNFFSHYFGWRELGILSIVVAVYARMLGDRFPVLLAFWAVPALLSSVQLFYFGTFRPHRLESVPFADNHRSRSENFSWVLSLLTCFHFGYHHEHHEKPWVPWWKLPAVHKSLTIN